MHVATDWERRKPGVAIASSHYHPAIRTVGPGALSGRVEDRPRVTPLDPVLPEYGSSARWDWHRNLMPDQMKQISLATPHAWALDAYSQLLVNPEPQLSLVWLSCGVLTLFGIAFMLVAWRRMKLD